MNSINACTGIPLLSIRALESGTMEEPSLRSTPGPSALTSPALIELKSARTHICDGSTKSLSSIDVNGAIVSDVFACPARSVGAPAHRGATLVGNITHQETGDPFKGCLTHMILPRCLLCVHLAEPTPTARSTHSGKPSRHSSVTLSGLQPLISRKGKVAKQY